MNKTKIEWCDYTWNPVVGCKHGCPYCYARRINQRFKYINNWAIPEFFPKRLADPGKVKKPSTIFVGSMCDLFGSWVPAEWILKILAVAGNDANHQFMFLTKNPMRYLEFAFPFNCMIGTTITKMDETARMCPLVDHDARSFVSLEPLLSDMSGADFSGIDLVIVGAMTGPGATKPKREWVESIGHHNIFLKDNIKTIMGKV